jgi:pimeloyl-ACP methyl ester carboxylesterase
MEDNDSGLMLLRGCCRRAQKRHHKEKPMNAFFSTQAGCVVRWLDLPGDGVPLVFVHGLGCASSYEYPRVVCDKNFQGRRAILIDLPGYGYSEKPKEFRYSISEQAAVVAN